MGLAVGRRALQQLFNWIPRQSYYKELRKLRIKVADAYLKRSEVTGGGLASDPTTTGSVSETVPLADITGAISSVMLGRIMDDYAEPGADFNLLTGPDSCLFSDGSDGSGADLDTDEVAYITLILCNSAGDGTADEDDGGTPFLVALVAGTGTGAYDDDALSSSEIQAALEASEGNAGDDDHSGVTSWIHLAEFTWDENSGSPEMTVVANRNNVVQEA